MDIYKIHYLNVPALILIYGRVAVRLGWKGLLEMVLLIEIK